MTKPTTPYQPYAALHEHPNGEGDARPTALQIVQDCAATDKLKGKTILITGCTSGIGIETARALYETGAQLILTARDLTKLHSVISNIISHSSSTGNESRPKPEALELHLDSLASVRAAVAELAARPVGARLDILVMNAGVMAVPLGRTADGFETHMGTNHYAHFLLFQLLKPKLLQSAAQPGAAASRVVLLSSAGHRWSGIRLDDPNWEKSGAEQEYNKWTAYGQSKTANIYTASAIDRRYAGPKQNLVAVAVHPGGINTDLTRYLSKEEIDGLNLSQYAHMYKSAEQGAATTVWAVLSPHFEGKNGGRYLADCGECGPMPEHARFASGYAAHVYDEDAEEKLWKMSYEAVGLKLDD